MTSAHVQPPFHIPSILNPTSPNSRITLSIIFVVPFTCFLSGIALYRAHLTSVPVETNTARGGDWADEVAFSSVFPPPPPTSPHQKQPSPLNSPKTKQLFLSLLPSLLLLARLSFPQHTRPLPLKYYLTLDLLTWLSIAGCCTAGLLFSNVIPWGKYTGIACPNHPDPTTKAENREFNCQPFFGPVQGLDITGFVGGFAIW